MSIANTTPTSGSFLVSGQSLSLLRHPVQVARAGPELEMQLTSVVAWRLTRKLQWWLCGHRSSNSLTSWILFCCSQWHWIRSMPLLWNLPCFRKMALQLQVSFVVYMYVYLLFVCIMCVVRCNDKCEFMIYWCWRLFLNKMCALILLFRFVFVRWKHGTFSSTHFFFEKFPSAWNPRSFL